MLFDTLDEALADIDSLQDYNLDHLIKHYGISFQYSSSLPNRVYGFSLPYTNTMFINSNTEYPERIKAHELIHCLVDDSANPLIESTYVSNTKIEGRADRGGFYLMIMDYLNLTSIEPSQFNILKFCEQYHVPEKYVYTAGLVANQVLDISLDDDDFIAN